MSDRPARDHNRVIEDAQVLADFAVQKVSTSDRELVALIREKVRVALDGLKMPESQR